MLHVERATVEKYDTGWGFRVENVRTKAVHHVQLERETQEEAVRDMELFVALIKMDREGIFAVMQQLRVNAPGSPHKGGR